MLITGVIHDEDILCAEKTTSTLIGSKIVGVNKEMFTDGEHRRKEIRTMQLQSTQ
jgi:hypothetical protein